MRSNLNVLGVRLRRAGRLAAAAGAFDRVVRVNPWHAKAWRNLAAVRCDLGDVDGARAALEVAAELDPVGTAAAVSAFAGALLSRGRVVEASEAGRRAIALDGGRPEGFVQLGRALHKLRRLEEAITAYDGAAAVAPGEAPAKFYRSLARLTLGDFARGWDDYEARLELEPVLAPPPAAPRWDGGELRGRTVLWDAEQGLGDTIQFLRFAPVAAGCGGRILVRCQSRLRALVEGVKGVEGVITAGDALPPVDCWLPMMSLPRVLKVGQASVPSRVPYLRLPAKELEEWRQRLEAAAPSGESGGRRRIRVGLAWAGSGAHDSDRDRSASPAELAPLGAADVQWIHLQRGSQPPHGLGSVEVQGANDGMNATAAVIAHLDLVVTVDTSIAHLAGALGRPVWVALTFMPDWRWMLGRSDSPWYPTMRLFRQDRPGDWAGVFQRMAGALAERRLQ